MKKKALLFYFILLLFPIHIFAYSNRIAVGGETIGIEVHSDGVYVVGFYDVSGRKIAEDAGFQIGDIIKEIDHNETPNVVSLNQLLQDEKDYTFTVLRNHEKKDINLFLKLDNNLLKTGLYVKDQINGIGTLSYIDPETKIFGSLGHEILESSSTSKFQLKNGTIYKAEVSSIKKSINGSAGEKNAKIDKNIEVGNIEKNEIEGIFGKYTNDFSDKEILEVADKNEIRKGEASIRTVVKDDKVEEYKINIISIDEEEKNKNILFEITDKDLIQKSGGIVQGMSGSPIIQNNKIIGVVNYVIVDEAKKGFGIFIKTMLEEGDKNIS